MAKFPNDGDGPMLALLARYGVSKVYADFDGGGDSGQVNEVTIDGLANGADADKIELTKEDHDKHADDAPFIGQQVKTLRDLIEAFVYELVERGGEDWVNNDGGHGEVTIVPGDGTIKVDMNVRFTSSEEYPHDYSIEVESDG